MHSVMNQGFTSTACSPHSETYEIMRPESIGIKQTTMVLGKHSGQHAFNHRMKELGYELDAELSRKLFEDFKHLARQEERDHRP